MCSLVKFHEKNICEHHDTKTPSVSDGALISISLAHRWMDFARLLSIVKVSTQKRDIKRRPYGINCQKHTSHNSGNTIVIKQWHAKRTGNQAESEHTDLLMKAAIFTGDTQTHTQSWFGFSSKYAPAGYPRFSLLSSPWQQEEEPGDTQTQQ